MEATRKFIHVLRIRLNEYRIERKNNPIRFNLKKISEPITACFHPIRSFSAIKTEGFGSGLSAFAVWVCLFLTAILEFFETGFLFNENRPDDFNILILFSTSSLLVLVWCIVNWSLCTLLDGKGTFREIWITVCYGMMPKVIFGIPLIVFSHVLCVEESALYVMLQSVIALWCGLLIFVGLLIIHEYTFSKTLFSCLLTAVGIVMLAYLIMLFISMVQQLFVFVQTVFQEITIRR